MDRGDVMTWQALSAIDDVMDSAADAADRAGDMAQVKHGIGWAMMTWFHIQARSVDKVRQQWSQKDVALRLPLLKHSTVFCIIVKTSPAFTL
jgi:hypothetical protein